MSKIRVKDKTKFYSRIGLMATMIVLAIILIVLVSGDDDVEAATPQAVAYQAPQPIELYRGSFVDLQALPEGVFDVMPKGFNYPKTGVRGLYISAFAAGSQEIMDEVVEIMKANDLNSLVIDFKDDYGYTRVENQSSDALIRELTQPTYSKQLLDDLRSEGIYLIARIVAFRDPALGATHPELAFAYPWGGVLNSDGQAFVNPLMKRVWDYNVHVAELALDLGFDEIQYDYVRFAEGFELVEHDLIYDRGDYADQTNLIARNQQAITDFMAYAKQRINAKNAKMSVDVFGYIAFDYNSGIGQDLAAIVENVDVLSAMIYPSHWGLGYFEIDIPDLEPYQVVTEYIEEEKEIFAAADKPPISRPWLQAFTAEYLGEGYYQVYGKEEVAQQIKALKDAGIEEYLLWRSNSRYRSVLEDQSAETDE